MRKTTRGLRNKKGAQVFFFFLKKSEESILRGSFHDKKRHVLGCGQECLWSVLVKVLIRYFFVRVKLLIAAILSRGLVVLFSTECSEFCDNLLAFSFVTQSVPLPLPLVLLEIKQNINSGVMQE